jgi:hypothetical protein
VTRIASGGTRCNRDSDVGLLQGVHTGWLQCCELGPSGAGTLIAVSEGMRCLLSGVVIAGVATGCGGLDRDIEDQITIDQGVYGLLLADDQRPAVNVEVVVYAPGSDDAEGTSDGDGVYQFAVPPGDYTLCTSSCVPVSVPAGTVRYDWTSGPGGGSWEPGQ